MIEISLQEMMKEYLGKRPENDALFLDLKYFVKDVQANGSITTLRFNNGYGALVFTPDFDGGLHGTTSGDTVYSVTWPDSAKRTSDYNVTHEPLGGVTHQKYGTYEEMRAILRKIQDYGIPPF